jgi:hypothetical protein
MLKTGVHGGRKHQICRAELFDAPESLELRRVHQFDFQRSDLDISMNRIAD